MHYKKIWTLICFNERFRSDDRIWFWRRWFINSIRLIWNVAEGEKQTLRHFDVCGGCDFKIARSVNHYFETCSAWEFFITLNMPVYTLCKISLAKEHFVNTRILFRSPIFWQYSKLQNMEKMRIHFKWNHCLFILQRSLCGSDIQQYLLLTLFCLKILVLWVL